MKPNDISKFLREMQSDITNSKRTLTDLYDKLSNYEYIIDRISFGTSHQEALDQYMKTDEYKRRIALIRMNKKK